jgi:tetratricopeptide (TPR) repeat protein
MSMPTRRAVVAAITLLAFQTTAAVAQGPDPAAYPKLARDGQALSQAAAEGLEDLLSRNPERIAARIKLLGFYSRGAAMRIYGQDATIEARRRHILWFIEHHPESEATELSEATIDRAGHALADSVGYDQASALWIEQARLRQDSAAVLKHAARFFQLSDKERAISLLRQAQHAAPDDAELPARIGYVYALAILGVDMINHNGLPMSHSAAEARGDFALRARSELTGSSEAMIVGNAGWIIGQYGLIVSGMLRDKFTVDYFPLAEQLLGRAHELDPSEPTYLAALEQLRTLRTAGRH